MLTPLKRALRSSRSATVIATLSLAVLTVGVAGAATLPDDAADEAKTEVAELEVPADEHADERATDAHENADNGDGPTSEGEGPDTNASDTATSVHDFIANWEGDKDCQFGLGVAATASGGNADLPEDCGGSDSDDLTSTSSVDEAEDGLSEANDNATVDVPADRSQGEDSAGDNHPGYDTSNNSGSDGSNNPGSHARSNAGGPPSDR